jgi:drug/metabolite transporter (DMT)-like permease
MYSPIYIGIFFGLLAMAFEGTTNLLSSMLNKRYDSLRMALWYFILSSIILGFGLMFFKLPQISGYYTALFVVLSLVSAGGLLTFYKALRVGKLSVVSPISGASVVITVAMGLVILGESLTALQAFGVITTIIGIILVSFKIKELRHLKAGHLTKGVGYAIATMFLWGIFYGLVGILAKSFGWFWPLFLSTVGSMVILLAYAAIRGMDVSFPAKSSKLVAAWITVGTLAFAFYSIGVNYGYISLVSPLESASPFVAIILAYALLKERLDKNQIVGMALIIIGIVSIAI